RHGGTVPDAGVFAAARREEVKQPSGILGIAGTAALSPFRRRKLLERLRAIEPAVTALDSRFMHFVECTRALTAGERAVLPALFDRMTEMALLDPSEVARLFAHAAPRPLERVPLAAGRAAPVEADRARGLALSAEEIDYLLEIFARLRRDPSDVELMMFAQA